MAGIKPEIHVRRARPEDYDEVTSIIADLWGGTDYLPWNYHSYFSDPQAFPFVGEVNGKVVAFANYYVVDDGETAVATGLRSLSEYRGLGLVAKVMSASLEAAKVRFPQLKTLSKTAVDSDFYDQYKKPNPNGIEITYMRAYLQFLTTTDKLLQLNDHLDQNTQAEKQAGAHNTVTIEPDSFFIDKLLKTNLFPESSFMIYNYCLPLKVTKKNLTLVCHTTNVVASLDKSGDKCCGISFGTFTQVKRGPSMVIYFHVTSLNDLLLHLKCHLQDNKQVLSNKEDANLELMFPTSLPSEELKQIVFSFIGENVTYKEVPREAVIIVEQPLPAE